MERVERVERGEGMWEMNRPATSGKSHQESIQFHRTNNLPNNNNPNSHLILQTEFPFRDNSIHKYSTNTANPSDHYTHYSNNQQIYFHNKQINEEDEFYHN